MLTVDPGRLARRQIEIDRKRTGRFPHLFAHKAERMSASPLALLRGAAPVFYELLERHPTLAEGPPGEGWLVGDAHLENFGAYRAGPLSVGDDAHKKENVVFDLNDFDDAFVGPWRYDVLRLATSLILVGREIGTDGTRTLELCEGLLQAHTDAAFSDRKAPAAPAPVAALVDKVKARSRKELLDARTTVTRGVRKFVRGKRYEALKPKVRARAEKAFAKFVKKSPEAARVPVEAFEVLDAAFRVAGTGSLGTLRIALLLRGKGGVDGNWVFDMKQEDQPSAACLVRPPKLEPAERVHAALQACLARPPRMAGATRLRGMSMLVRRLSPQEDKLDWKTLRPEDLDPLARHLGALLGAAHRRGARRKPKRAWDREDRASILTRAIALAGAHEAMYLAYAGLVGHLIGRPTRAGKR
jgi:uncharacterized protein (DUF2252 family)